jgi:hypothetical protein
MFSFNPHSHVFIHIVVFGFYIPLALSHIFTFTFTLVHTHTHTHKHTHTHTHTQTHTHTHTHTHIRFLIRSHTLTRVHSHVVFCAARSDGCAGVCAADSECERVDDSRSVEEDEYPDVTLHHLEALLTIRDDFSQKEVRISTSLGHAQKCLNMCV